ncbi:unnamed protein product, partial [Linum tenue]
TYFSNAPLPFSSNSFPAEIRKDKRREETNEVKNSQKTNSDGLRRWRRRTPPEELVKTDRSRLRR